MARGASSIHPRLFMATNLQIAKMGNRAVMEDLGQRLSTRGFPVYAASRKSGWILRTSELLYQAIARRRFYDVAVIDVYSYKAFAWADAVSGVVRALGRPSVLVLRGGSLPRFAEETPGRVRRALSRGNAVVAPSRYLQEKMRPYREGIEMIPNPLPLEAYRFRQRETVRPELIWLRTFRHFYNPVLAVKTLAQVAHFAPEARLTMIGHDDGDGTLEETQTAAKRLGVFDRIHFVGPVAKSEVPGWLDRGDILLNTPMTDNTPISVMEAMATGLCVVSTDVGGLPYLAEDGVDALLVPDDDASRMSAAVKRILTEPGLSGSLSSAARRSAERWDWPAVLPQWTDLLDRVARERA